MDYRIKENLEKLKEMWDKCPEEVKEATPFLIPSAIQVANTANTIQTINEITSIHTAIKSGSCSDPCSATRLLDSSSNNYVRANRTAIHDSLLNPTSSHSDRILQELQSKMTYHANVALTASAIAGAFVLAVEFVQLQKLWEAIKDAKNVAESSKRKREQISKSMSDIRKELRTLSDYVAKAEHSPKMRIRTNRQCDKIRELLNTIEKDIGDLEVQLNRVKVRLNDYRLKSKIGAGNTILHGGICLLNVMTIGKFASPWLVGANCILVVGNFLLSAENIRAMILSKEDVKKIQEELEEVENLKRDYNRLKADVNKEIEAAYDRMEDYAATEEAI